MMTDHVPMTDEKREEENNREMELTSNCCGADLLGYDGKTGMCSDCHEWAEASERKGL